MQKPVFSQRGSNQCEKTAWQIYYENASVEATIMISIPIFLALQIMKLTSIYIRFGNKLYRQIVGIPMGTNCAPLVSDLFLFCYKRDFMTSISDDTCS